VVGRQTTPQLRPPQLVSLNRLLLVSFQHFPLPGLSLTVLVEELPGIGAGDRLPANIVGPNLDATAVELDQPAGCRRGKSSSSTLNGMRSEGSGTSAGAGSATGAVLLNIQVLRSDRFN
jgi:hypothetical protein